MPRTAHRRKHRCRWCPRRFGTAMAVARHHRTAHPERNR